MPSAPLFPPRAERRPLDFVLTDFPFPLALTYARLQGELDAQEPVAAAWQLRDAFECLLKFTACLALADFLQDHPPRAQAERLVGLLMKPTGPSLGDWHTLLELALDPLEPLAAEGRLAESGRRLPELYGLLFTPRGDRTPLNTMIDGQPDSFVRWRNAVFGHGVFKQERSWYADQVLGWLPHLHGFYEALRPVLAGWRLVGRTPGGEEVDWQGCDEPAAVRRHEHQPWGEPLPMLLAPGPTAGKGALPLGPLLSVQECTVCRQPAAFFFDRHHYERRKDRHRTCFLEYFRGHDSARDNWEEARRLAALLPAEYVWRRLVWDTGEALEGVRLVFRDFDAEYRRPDYLLDALWQRIDERRPGYVHVVGPGGVGKTYLLRGLEREGRERDRAVLVHHILPGAGPDEYQRLVSALADQAAKVLGVGTVEIQTRVSRQAELMGQFVEFVRVVMEFKRLRTLVIALDALDELLDPEATTPALTDLLPAANQLPRGCVVVLASRPGLRPRAHARLEELRQGPPGSFTRLEVRPDSPDNERLLTAYLREHLPAPFRAPEHMAEVLRRSGGTFLYAFHLCRALESGAFRDTAALPEGEQFYPAYLGRLRERVSGGLFEEVYLRSLLLLAAARQPVTLEQLVRWGVPRERLRFALLDLGDFLRVHRGRRWHDSLNEDGEDRYELAHEAFVRFVKGDANLSRGYREAHARIARAALATHAGRWAELDGYDEASLYDLCFVFAHLHEAGLREDEERLLGDEAYASACWRVGDTAMKGARSLLAIELYGGAVAAFRRLVQGRRLAAALNNRGNALRAQGRLAEADVAYGEAVALLGRLIKEEVEDEDRADLANDLATALANRGAGLAGLGRLAEAVAACDQAVALLRHMVEDEGRDELDNDLAKILVNRGLALRSQGRLAEAVAAYDEAVALFRRPVLGDRGGLAKALVNRAVALQDEGRLAEALVTCDEAIALLRRLAEDEESPDLVNNLALALVNRGVTLRGQARLAEAVAAYDESIALYRRLVQEGRAELASHLVGALRNRGVALEGQCRLAEAVAAYDEAVALCRRLVQGGRSDLANDLAAALTNRGLALAAQGRQAEAVAADNEAVVLYRRLVQGGRSDLANDLAMVLMNLGLVLDHTAQPQQALSCFTEAIETWGGLIRRGLVHLTPLLLKALRIRFGLFHRRQEWEAAARELLDALDYYESFYPDGNPPESVVWEIDSFLWTIQELPPDERNKLDDALREKAAEWLRQQIGLPGS